MNNEQRRAVMEGERNGAADDYFAARPALDNEDNRDLFAAGFVRGYGAAVCKSEANTKTKDPWRTGYTDVGGWV